MEKVGYEQTEADQALCAKAVVLFECDDARVSKPMGKLFLIIGHKRRSVGQWKKYNGTTYEPFDFDYLDEACIASGVDHESLWASALEYKRLLGLKPDQYLQELAGMSK